MYTIQHANAVEITVNVLYKMQTSQCPSKPVHQPHMKGEGPLAPVNQCQSMHCLYHTATPVLMTEAIFTPLSK